MSDKLVVEFCEEHGEPKPIAAAMVLHGGDNPSSASLTVAAFVAATRSSHRDRAWDAYELASRFIVWNAIGGKAYLDSSALEAELIPVADSYPYQLVRIFVNEAGLRVVIVPDDYSTAGELAEANLLLSNLALVIGEFAFAVGFTQNPATGSQRCGLFL